MATVLGVPAVPSPRAASSLAASPLARPPDAGPGAAGAPARRPAQIAYRSWDTAAELRTGHLRRHRGPPAAGCGSAAPTAPRHASAGRRYAVGTWTSPWVVRAASGSPSWCRPGPRAPPTGTLVQVEVRGASRGRHPQQLGHPRPLGRAATATFRRTSLGSQTDDLARVATDTWLATHGGFTLLAAAGHACSAGPARTLTPRGRHGRRDGLGRCPHVDRVTTLAARRRPRRRCSTCRATRQMVHAGEYPQYGGGGEAWCSPTSTTMVLAYYGSCRPPAEYAWVQPVVRRPGRRPRRPDDLRPRLRRHRQLAVQHRLRRAAAPGTRFVTRLRVAARRRAVHPGRHPRRHLDHVLAAAS